MKINIDTSKFSDYAKDKLTSDIAYFEKKYDGRFGTDLTESEIDEILSMPIDFNGYDYAIVYATGRVPRVARTELGADIIDDGEETNLDQLLEDIKQLVDNG